MPSKSKIVTDGSLSEDYVKGYNDALVIAKKIFFDFIDERRDKGIFLADQDHIRAYKRYFTERIRHQGAFADRVKGNSIILKQKK